MANIELDPAIKLCLKHLHSGASDSTEQLRLTLDEVIRQTYGNAKTLGQVLPKKYLTEEKTASPRHKSKIEKAVGPLKVALPVQSPQQIRIPERVDDDGNPIHQELPLDLLEEDLTCAVCRQIDVQVGNRLVECESCHALYHQDCHSPIISDNDMTNSWRCSSCLNGDDFTASSFAKQHTPTKSPPSSTQWRTEIARVSSPSGSSSGSSKLVSPSINIISADKRLQIMKKKAAKQHDKRKHSK